LRLRDGIDRLALRRRFGADAVDALEPRVRDLTSRGLLERTETAVRLTHRGLMLADTVIVELMAD
ncbi:MAG: coproporphyrinogen III oxidase, partial [Armatimonadetes bacterium]|nr:coproporphyrinogen III oxidase [Armatimonadota bacterium]